ncbi:MAG: glycosyltransferase family 4 protein [Planctomycetota bacterium]
MKPIRELSHCLRQYRKISELDVDQQKFERRLTVCESCTQRKDMRCQTHKTNCASHAKLIGNHCEHWGEPKPKTSVLKSDQLGSYLINSSPVINDNEKIKVGFILHGLAFGGISRHVLTMMEAPGFHGIEWAGIAVSTLKHMDSEVVERIRRFCPVYAVDEYHLVEKSENPYQSVVDLSDVICFSSFIQSEELFGKTDWKNKPIVTTAHGQCEYSVRQIETALKYGGRKVYLAVSRAAVKSYPAELRDQVTVIYNGIDFSRCAPTRRRDEIRESWGVGPDVKAIGYLGRMARDKNCIATARAVAELGEGYHAVYLGNGYAEAEIRNQVRKICGDACTLLDKEELVGNALSALDAIVIASPEEGGPMIASEAWLSGCPVVATPVGMIPELEDQHGTLTQMIPVNADAKTIAKAVTSAVRDTPVTRHAREVAWMLFSPAIQVQRFERAIRGGIHSGKNIPVPATVKPDQKRVGFCIGTCSMGGVTRGILALMDQGCSGIVWSGIAIEGPGSFDPICAKRMLEYCPVFCTQDAPKFEGLVTVVPNACQEVVSRSDTVKLWGHICPRPELDKTNWDTVEVITAAHGQCDWTVKNINTSLKYGKYHKLLSVSGGGVKCFPEHLRDRVAVIYNGLDFTRCVARKSRRQMRAEWGVSDEKIIIAYLGRFEKSKNPQLVAKSVAKLGAGYHALIVGEGVDNDEIIRESLHDCGRKHITILGNQDDVGSVLNAVDFILMAGPTEGCPQVMMEAFGARCPVISTRTGFLEEFEKPFGKLVFEIPFDPTPKDVANAVTFANSRLAEDDEMLERAFLVAMKQFNLRKHAMDFSRFVHDKTNVVSLGEGHDLQPRPEVCVHSRSQMRRGVAQQLAQRKL